ncbi:hypothetical protein Neosp_008973 [[Neocosmospora] mangrovei]
MRRSRLTGRDGSRPIDDFDDPRPRKSARTDEPQPPTSDSDVEEAPPAAAKKQCGRPKKGTDVDPDSSDLARLRPLLEVRNALKDDDIDRVVGPAEPIFDTQWTQQDEDAMMLVWDSSPEKAVCATIRPDNGAIRSLWKACLRIFRCTPLDLLSPLMNLRFQPLVASNGVLPQKFCRHLAALIVQPIWRGTPRRLAVALQYAVISRTDDRRPWKVAVQCSTLKALAVEIKKVNGPTMPVSIHEMLAGVRERDCDIKDSLSDIVYEIGEMMIHSNFKTSRAPAEDTVYRGHQVYLITTQDLQVVSKAVDKVGLGPVERTYEAFKSLRGNTDVPRSEQLLDFHMRAGKRQLRLLAKAEAGAETQVTFDPVDESSLEYEAQTSQHRPPSKSMASEASPDKAPFTTAASDPDRRPVALRASRPEMQG